MKVTKTILILFILTLLVSSCHKDLDDVGNGNLLIDTPTDTIINENIEYKWWMLAHKNYEAPGIYLYNETTSTIELKLNLPENIESPHALAYDGEFLWLGGIGENESIYQLNAATGAIISEIKNIKTEGIALLDDYLYYSDNKSIKKIKKNGTLLHEISTRNSSYSIPDIAIANNNLYYLRYSEEDPVIKLSLSSEKESGIPITESIGTYSLTISNNEIITISPMNEISHFNVNTGAFISTQATIMKGWITAIATNDVN